MDPFSTRFLQIRRAAQQNLTKWDTICAGGLIFHWFYNTTWHFVQPFTHFYDLDRFHKGLVMILTDYRYRFYQESVDSNSFTTGSAKPFELIFVLSDASSGHFGTAGLLFGPDFLQRPSLRVWPPELKGKIIKLSCWAQGPDLGIQLAPRGPNISLYIQIKSVSFGESCLG